MYCKKCGAPLKDGAMFCARCGEKVPTEQPGAFAPAQQPVRPAAPVPPAAQPRSPFEPAQRTADRVFPSQQRGAQQQFGAAQTPYAPAPQGPAQPPYAAAQPYVPAQPGAGIDWEHFQPRSSPKSANRLIWGVAVLMFAVVVMIWTMFIR